MKRSIYKQLLFRSIAAMTAAWTLSACGNLGSSYLTESTTESSAEVNSKVKMTPYKTIYNSEGKDAQGCPIEPNVLPEEDWLGNGAMKFTVCSRSENYSELTIKGLPSSGTRICVFPAERSDETHIAAKPNLSNGFPLYQCVTANDLGGTRITFPSDIKFNFLFIVKQSDVNAMQLCLGTGNYSDCPIYRPSTFSSGSFRD